MADLKVKTTREENKFLEELGSLVYLSGKNWLPLPSWARYFLKLGVALSDYENDGKNFVAALTIPTRSFVTSLIASGIIVSRAGLSSNNMQDYIDKIKSLPIGTPVIFRTDNRQYKGVFNGIVSCSGNSYFLVRYQKNAERSIPIENAYKIEILDKQDISLPKVQSGHQLSLHSPLLPHLLDKSFLTKLVLESKFECVILGQLSTHQDELCNFPIGFKKGEDIIDVGTLLDFVRPKGIQFQPTNVSYRSLILPPSGKYNSQFASKFSNYVTIFDSALGFIKWRNSFNKSNWIVILDKTDRSFDLAITEINGEYINYRLEKPSKISLPIPPPGIELMYFEVKS